MKVATDPEVAYVTAPVTATPPGPVTVKEPELMVAGLSAWLKVAVIAVVIATAVTPETGVVAPEGEWRPEYLRLLTAPGYERNH